MGSRLTAFRDFWKKLEEVELQPPIPPPLPPGRIEMVPGRGEVFVREIPGRPDQPTILLLHGWTLTADVNWFTAYDTIARHGRVLAMDQRGHGRGLRSEETFTLDAAADDATGLLRHLEAGPAIIVGYSMGGSVGLVQSRRHPETVAGLVLQSTGLQWRASLRERVLWTGMAAVEYGLRFGTPRKLTDRYLRMALEQRPDLEPHLPWLKAEIRRGDPSNIAAASRALSAFDARPFAGSINVPAVVVVSRQDRLIRSRRQHELIAALRGAQSVEVDAAHNGWMLKPEEVADALDEAVGMVATQIAADH